MFVFLLYRSHLSSVPFLNRTLLLHSYFWNFSIHKLDPKHFQQQAVASFGTELDAVWMMGVALPFCSVVLCQHSMVCVACHTMYNEYVYRIGGQYLTGLTSLHQFSWEDGQSRPSSTYRSTLSGQKWISCQDVGWWEPVSFWFAMWTVVDAIDGIVDMRENG